MADIQAYLAKFDAVIMLTWSNWFTEMRSNRYHYASRFARYRPVYFVQPDLFIERTLDEPTELPALRVVQTYREFGGIQTGLLKSYFNDQQVRNPLIWVYNYRFMDFALSIQRAGLVYHATEDYFAEAFDNLSSTRGILLALLKEIDALICVSDGVLDSYIERGRYTGPSIVAPNGCDYQFWSGVNARVRNSRLVLYQGGIHKKLDFNLIKYCARSLRDWSFLFCGRVQGDNESWRELLKEPNVKYLGQLPVEAVRELASQASVGIIPFVQEDWIVNRSLPLKAYEYVAAGLPVVTVPIKALSGNEGIFVFADTPAAFVESIQMAAATAEDQYWRQRRIEVAQRNDYESRFEEVASFLSKSTKQRRIEDSSKLPRAATEARRHWLSRVFWHCVTLYAAAAATLLGQKRASMIVSTTATLGRIYGTFRRRKERKVL